MRKVGSRVRGTPALAPAVQVAEDRRQGGQKALGAADRARSGPHLVRLEVGQRAHRGTQDVHRGGPERKAVEESDQLGGNGAAFAEQAPELRELLRVREAAVPEQIRRLLEGRFGRQSPYVVAPVDEPSEPAIDEADLRFERDNVLQSLLDQ